MIAINTKPTSDSLQNMHRDLSHRNHIWPSPRVDSPLVTEGELRRARDQWSHRACATYISTTRAASIFHQLTLLSAPLTALTGASYTVAEMTRHLSITLHIAAPLEVSENLRIQEQFFHPPQPPPTWEQLFDQVLQFFCFNLALSVPVYEAISAATSDKAIAELATAQAESLAELVGYGHALISWMGSDLPTRTTAATQARLPGLLAAFESLCGGSAEVLDQLAGTEISVETRSGNLGTLDDHHRAAIFYHALNNSIFPVLDDLGWQGFEAWRRHYRHGGSLEPRPIVVAGIGTHDSL